MTPSPTTAPLTDVGSMAVIHTVYRREFRLAAGLVRGVADGDVRRARVVADHLAVVGDHLHRHHTHEDEMLWPLMLQRVPDELAPIVELMETQHHVVDALQDQVAAVMPRWRQTARRVDRERLAELHDRLYVNLVEHLDAEEQRLLPIAARTVTQQEWDAMAESGRTSTPRRELLLTFGLIAYEGDPDRVAGMLADAPAPVRVLLPALARRAFARHSRRVHGTATP